MEFLNEKILLVNDFIWTYILIAMLIVIGLYFTFKTKFVQFSNIKEMFKLLGEGTSSKDKAKEIASATLDNYSEDELKFYDFSFFLKWKGEEGDTVVTGNKHHSLDSITWTNN